LGNFIAWTVLLRDILYLERLLASGIFLLNLFGFGCNVSGRFVVGTIIVRTVYCPRLFCWTFCSTNKPAGHQELYTANRRQCTFLNTVGSRYCMYSTYIQPAAGTVYAHECIYQPQSRIGTYKQPLAWHCAVIQSIAGIYSVHIRICSRPAGTVLYRMYIYHHIRRQQAISILY
jgi:hypothetical protein